MQDKLPIISLQDVRVHYAAEGGEVKRRWTESLLRSKRESG